MFSINFVIWGLIAAVSTAGMGAIFRKKWQIGRAVLMFVLFYAYAWFYLPPLAIDMLGTWVSFLLILALSAILTTSRDGDSKISRFLVPASFALVMLTGMIGTSSLFNAKEMAAVLNVEDHGQKATTIELISQEKAQRVTEGLAQKRGAELIGTSTQKGLASIAEYGDFYGNVTKEGEAVWVAPLEPLSLFRWLANRTTPGYFIVSQLNNMESRLVEDRPIAYGPDFYFGNNLSRHLYIKGYTNYSYGNKFFQIDDEGVPYYVVPLERPQVGFWSDFPEKWAVVNAQTGEITEAKNNEELPSWIDRAYSTDVMFDRLSDWGCYSNGWWACRVSKVEAIEPTPDMLVSMNNSDQMVYYTGTQFKNNTTDGATSGVAVINSRTGKTDFYRRAGITETAAQDVINGAVSNYTGWSAESPILIQINGIETYFSVITDHSGALKHYGMVSQRNRDVYGVGSTVEDVTRTYLRAVKRNENMTAFEGNAEAEEITYEGMVEAITPVIRGGETSFYLRIDSVRDKVFVVNAENPAEVATTTIGQMVRVTALNPEPEAIEAETFSNLSFTLKKSVGQANLEEETGRIMEVYKEEESKSNLQIKLDQLEPKEVQELLQQVQ